MHKEIVLLGWGSLIWDIGSLEKRISSEWEDGGPTLPIEFSRISTTRKGALTLVIDEDNGEDIQTQYIMSNRSDPKDAACDLRDREGTVHRHIGMIDLRHGTIKSKSSKIAERIAAWAEAKGIRAVVWTNLPSNFEDKARRPFSVDEASKYLRGLEPKAMQKAKEYIRKAPKYVDTPLRRQLTEMKWIGE